MSSATVDVEGNRVITDVLVAGYTHETTNMYDLVIPNEIVGIIFIFWFIDACDQWDQSFCHESVDFYSRCVKMTDEGVFSIFGMKSVKSGIFEWELEFKTYVTRGAVGLIQDSPEILRKYHKSDNFAMHGDGIALFGGTGSLCGNGFMGARHEYCPRFPKKDTLIVITLNMKKMTISYRINDTQYEAVGIPESMNGYRLAVMIDNIGAEIELL